MITVTLDEAWFPVVRVDGEPVAQAAAPLVWRSVMDANVLPVLHALRQAFPADPVSVVFSDAMTVVSVERDGATTDEPDPITSSLAWG